MAMNAKQGRNLAAIGAVIAYLLGLDGCRSGARAAASIGTCSPIPPSKPPPPPNAKSAADKSSVIFYSEYI